MRHSYSPDDPEFPRVPPPAAYRVGSQPDLFDPLGKFGETLTPADLPRLRNKLAAVVALMLDGAWHTLDEIRAVGGSSGDRRLRQLRDEACGALVVEARREHETSGAWRYRLSPDTTRSQLDRARTYLTTHTREDA